MLTLSEIRLGENVTTDEFIARYCPEGMGIRHRLPSRDYRLADTGGAQGSDGEGAGEYQAASGKASSVGMGEAQA